MAQPRHHETSIRIRDELGLSSIPGVEATGDLRQTLRDWAADNVFGDIWARPGLDLKNRSRITIAMLTALRAMDQLEIHLQVGLNVGLTQDEICEILLHAAPYCGCPASSSALALADVVFARAGSSSESTDAAMADNVPAQASAQDSDR